MEVAIRKMGNSQGVLIPKPILAQVGLEGTADLQVRDGVIEIRAVRRNPREGWEAGVRSCFLPAPRIVSARPGSRGQVLLFASNPPSRRACPVHCTDRFIRLTQPGLLQDAAHHGR